MIIPAEIFRFASRSTDAAKWLIRAFGYAGLIAGTMACSGETNERLQIEGTAETAITNASDRSLASATLCADSYLIALAPDRVSALSWQAGSDLSMALSSPAVNLIDRPQISDDPEAIYGLDGLVITGPGGPNQGDVALSWGEDFAIVEANLHSLSAATGLDVSPMLSALKTTENLPRPAQSPRILYLSRSGGSAGPGTYVDAVITRAGGINAAKAPGWHTPSVETLMSTQADIILTSFFGSDYYGISDRAIRHKALADYIAKHPRIDVPGRLWPCAGPGLIEATQIVNAAIMDWDATR